MYPHTKLTESKVVRWLHDLWHGPRNAEPYGEATIGSSEACMMAGLAHKWNWRKKREAAGKDASRPNLVTGGNVQIVWKKFMRYFDVEPPCGAAQSRATIDSPQSAWTSSSMRTPPAWSRSPGRPSPVRTTTSRGSTTGSTRTKSAPGTRFPMHIDAASGGFVNPFLYPDYAWDFRLPRVQSINTSGHKFGLVYPGLGWLVFRERAVFPEDLVFYVNYLGGEAPTATLNFSKGAATVLMQYYQILRFGREGYTRIMQHALDNSLVAARPPARDREVRPAESKPAHPGRRAVAQARRDALQRVRHLEQNARARLGSLRLHNAAEMPKTCARCASW